MSRRSKRPSAGSIVAAVTMVAVVLGTFAPATDAGAATATVNGQGSTYAALAFQTWTQGAEINDGLTVNYTATGSPAGLSAYGTGTATFAGTEAEYSELYAGTPDPTQHVPRGFAYTPDVAGAIAVMYHVQTPGGTTVSYLHLTPLTIARIFMGYIRTWTSPTISEDNKGLVLPHQRITLDIRAGQSGTTALFYDWVKHTDPTQFTAWAQSNGFTFGPTTRIWEVDNGYGFGHGPGFNALGGSDQQAEAIASRTGLWSIGYDEFGYAFVYHDNVAWVQNASGNWVQPYARNIASALTRAVLARDTSQTLVGVYTNPTPTAYPMSAYSYILYQCAATPTRPTCKGSYSSQAVINTMAKFLRYIACTGQVRMAQIGYSPLPPELSQFLANAIGYMTGQSPETLSASNCTNPQFRGRDLGVGATPPPDPTKGVASLGPGPGGKSAGSNGTTSGGATNGSSSGTPGTSGAGGAPAGTAVSAIGKTGSAAKAVGGGSTSWLTPNPVVYKGPAVVGAGPPWPFLVLVLLLLVPVVWLTLSHRRRRGDAPEDGHP